LLAVFLVGATSSAQAPPLLVNGSFEDGPNPGRWMQVAGGSTAIKGWVVTGEAIDYVGTLWRNSEGARSVDLDGSLRSTLTPPYAQGGIAQTFATKPGTIYLVTFDLAGNPYGPPAVKPLRISATGQEAEFTFDVTGKRVANMGWVNKTWTLTAKETSTTLEFRSLTVSPATGYGAVIDNVSVVVATKEQIKSRGAQLHGAPLSWPVSYPFPP